VATTPVDSRDEHAEEREQSLWASFSRADMRLFLVTFAGTVAANVVTVMVVAVAVIVARSGTSGRPTAGGVLIDLFCGLSGAMAVGIGVTAIRPLRKSGTQFRGVMLAIGGIAVATGLLGVVFLLIVLGYAVGVK
jgi:hypothetical protein